jgi:serine/threonine-protein kinase HipA
MAVIIELEIFVLGKWEAIGSVELVNENLLQGYKAPGKFNYHLSYLDLFADHLQSRGHFAVSVRYPLNYGTFIEKTWPAFLLDLIPTGAARQNWLKRLQLPDGPSADLALLSQGAINPPGQIRVKNNQNLFSALKGHSGFDLQEITTRGVDFIDYAEQMGAIVSGTSGAQGVAPKYLLVQDKEGRWHGDGAIADDRISSSWLVKLPRGRKKRDEQILATEAQYYEIARDLEVRTLGPLNLKENTLFVPRFDRDFDSQKLLTRLGLESLISAAGVSEFGANLANEDYVELIGRHATDPKTEIKEFIFRDLLNITCGNTDNHGRNTAFIKKINGTIELSPLFDFAPMVLDEAVIPRASKWKHESFQIPEFSSLAAMMATQGFATEEVKLFLTESLAKLQNLPELFKKHSVESTLQTIVMRKYDDLLAALEAFTRKL